MSLENKCANFGKGGIKCYCCAPPPGKKRRQIKRAGRRRAKLLVMKEAEKDLEQKD